MWVELDDIKMKERRGLVPDNMINRFVAIANIFDVSGTHGSNYGFVTDHLDAEGGMGKEDDDGVGGMEMSGGGVVHRDLSFEQPVVRVFLDDFMVGFPADGELGERASGRHDGG
jgi:hypothetical protein